MNSSCRLRRERPGIRRAVAAWACLLLFAALAPLTCADEPVFRLFDDFQDETLGPIGGQDGWVSSGGDNRVALDPADGGNQVLYAPADSSILSKSLLGAALGVPNESVRTLFFRLRVGNLQTFSVGLSSLTRPSEYSDFAPEIGMANSTPQLDLRVWDDDDGNYEDLLQLQPDRWYSLWVLIDARRNEYEVFLHDRSGVRAFPADQRAAPDGDVTFAFRSGRASDLVSFYLKSSGGGGGTNFGPVYIDDIHLVPSDGLLLVNPVAAFAGTTIDGLALAGDRTTLAWGALDGAATYDIVRGDLAILRASGGDFEAAVTLCLADGAPNPTASDPLSPPAGGGFFYVARGETDGGEAGTYDSSSAGQAASRDPGIEGSPASCP